MPENTFDLEQAIADWRAPYENQRRYSAEDIDELESHLRDQIQFAIDDGVDPGEAFRQAADDVGEAWSGEVEYRKVYWGKLRSPGKLMGDVAWFTTLQLNNARIAFRNLMRHKVYALTNLVGLTIAIAGCLMVLLYVRLETARGSTYPKTDRIYRVVSWTFDESGTKRFNRGSDGRIGPAMLENFPEVEQLLRSQTEWPMRLRAGETTLNGLGVSVVDRSVLSVLDLEFVRGTPHTALSSPSEALLKESTAKALFGTEDPIGKTVTLADHWGGDYVVSGVIADPEWTVFALNFDFVTTRRTHNAGDWDRVLMGSSWRPIQTFVLLREDADIDALNVRLEELNVHVNGQEWAGKSGYALQPLNRIHLYGHEDFPGIQAFGSIRTVQALVGIAAFVLLVACANFINLTTARFAQRTREIGIRKTVGARRPQLLAQFLSESLLLALAAGLMALVVTQVALPTFSTYLERSNHLSLDVGLETWTLFVGLVFIVGLLAGTYPALLSSSLRPTLAIAGKGPGGSRLGVRQTLVGIQFLLSGILVTSALIVHSQVEHLLERDIGINRSNVIWMGGGAELRNQRDATRQAFRDHPNIIGTTFTGRVPVFTYKEKVAVDGRPERHEMVVLEGDEDFVDVLGIEILAGRNFSREHPTDATQAVLINEAAVRELGWETRSADTSLDPIGKSFEQFRFRRQAQVVGVVRVHTGSLRSTDAPTFIRIRNSGMGSLLVRMRPEAVDETMAFLRKTWAEFAPGKPFRYRTLDGAVEHVYRDEIQVRDIASAFFVLAILIACIGLFALVAFAVEQRTKELGIRKAIGASTQDLFALLANSLLVPVGIATLVSWPFAFSLLDDWLAGFAHRIDLTVLPFALGTIGTLGAAVVTVGYRTLKAARVPPADALRYE